MLLKIREHHSLQVLKWDAHKFYFPIRIIFSYKVTYIPENEKSLSSCRPT